MLANWSDLWEGLPRMHTELSDGRPRPGFTMVELMIVVAIIGLLAALAVPSFVRARLNSQASAIVNDFRIFEGAFQHYLIANRAAWPPSDWVEGSYPVGMENNWLPEAWIKPTPVGGYYVYHTNGTERLIIVNVASLDGRLMKHVDQMLDGDGSLLTGTVRGDSGSLDYYMRE